MERAPNDPNLQAYNRAVNGTPQPAEAGRFNQMVTGVENVYTGKTADATSGATYYYSPRSMVPAGSSPAWATDGTKTKTLDLGSQGQFYRCDNGRPSC